MRYMRQISPRMYQRPKLARVCTACGMVFLPGAGILTIENETALLTAIVRVCARAASVFAGDGGPCDNTPSIPRDRRSSSRAGRAGSADQQRLTQGRGAREINK